MTGKKSEILIIGGGIGGLTLALALHKRRISCQTFEAAPEFKPLGVGINMMQHAIRVLTALGLQPSLENYGVEAKEFTFFNRHGQFIMVEPCGKYAGYEYPHFSIHRGDLHKVLFEAGIERLGLEFIHFGHRCAGVEQGADSVTGRFEGAEPKTDPIAIAVDGFHSAVRRQFYPARARHISAASICGARSHAENHF